ncbi:hypothetical protein [Thorsellia anophelis]|uniref:Uncharacterized protein n=1 Tax=Thorsellia anophelis DSM 18579 TaxID=1123402 RepID=A0A1I0FLY8_9GAMM|nr:hypothetical protein [Thorsellia anophelis]SET59242.1 hypothetical protein SAMN02583745_02811 [Thorsellia anophelis DSM 18579]
MDLSLLFKATMKLPLEWDITDIVTDQSHLKMNISLTYLPKECASEVCKTSSEIISGFS